MKMGIMGLGVIAGLFLCLLIVSMAPAVAGSPKVVSVSSSNEQSMALMDDGTVWAWGTNLYGEVGNDSIHNTSVWAPVKVEISDVKEIVEGMNYALALKNDGTVWGWGLDCVGNLGQSSFQNVTMPVQIKGLDHVAKISTCGGGWLCS